MNGEAIEEGKVAPQPEKRYLMTRILMASIIILSGITGAGITAALLMAKANEHDHASCHDTLPHFLGDLTINEDTVNPEHGTIQGDAVERLHALVTTSNGSIASGREFDVGVKLHVPTKNSSTNHTLRRLFELPHVVDEVKLHVKTTTCKLISSPANVSLPANNSLQGRAGTEWGQKDSVSPFLTLFLTEDTNAVVAMLCSRDTCVFAGEGYRQDAKTDNRRQLNRFGDLSNGVNFGEGMMAVALGGLTAIICWEPWAALGVAAFVFLPVVLLTVLFASVINLIGEYIYEGNCLPGDALVQQLIDYQPTLKPIASVPHGAHVLTSGGFSPIYLFSHKDHKATAVMRHIETESGHAIQLTRQHYIQANGQYMSAEKVAYGMQVPIRFLNGTLSMSAVHTVLDVEKQGLFNPMTMHGDVVVFSSGNSAAGVVVSDQSEWWAEGYLPESIIPSVYHTVLSPVRFLHSIAPAWTERFQAHTSNLLLSIPGSPSLDHLGFSGLVMAALHTSHPLMSMNSGSCVNILGT